MKVEIKDDVARELAYIVALHAEYGAPHPMPSVEALVQYVLSAVADGSRRPGSWERQLLQMMGLVADTDEHHQYRASHGRPENP